MKNLVIRLVKKHTLTADTMSITKLKKQIWMATQRVTGKERLAWTNKRNGEFSPMYSGLFWWCDDCCCTVYKNTNPLLSSRKCNFGFHNCSSAFWERRGEVSSMDAGGENDQSRFRSRSHAEGTDELRNWRNMKCWKLSGRKWSLHRLYRDEKCKRSETMYGTRFW